MDIQALDLTVQLLRSITQGLRNVYKDGFVPAENLAPLVAMVTSNILEQTTPVEVKERESVVTVYKKVTAECLQIADDTVQVTNMFLNFTTNSWYYCALIHIRGVLIF